jgi:hypothetical protein
MSRQPTYNGSSGFVRNDLLGFNLVAPYCSSTTKAVFIARLQFLRFRYRDILHGIDIWKYKEFVREANFKVIVAVTEAGSQNIVDNLLTKLRGTSSYLLCRAWNTPETHVRKTTSE